jgi:poly-beta-1,6-N-acetyl-D-glucosamine synthase
MLARKANQQWVPPNHSVSRFTLGKRPCSCIIFGITRSSVPLDYMYLLRYLITYDSMVRPKNARGVMRIPLSCASVTGATGARIVEYAKPQIGTYLLISPCRDEEKYMRASLDSVIGQSARGDDGSTAGTPRILSECQATYDWIGAVTLRDRARRSVKPAIIEAFYARHNSTNPGDYDYPSKSDRSQPRFATCSVKAYTSINQRPISESREDDASLGMTNFYRVSCFNAIAGFVRKGMWDGCDCCRCRHEPELCVHLRPMGSSHQGILAGCAHHGYSADLVPGFWLRIADLLKPLSTPGRHRVSECPKH